MFNRQTRLKTLQRVLGCSLGCMALLLMNGCGSSPPKRNNLTAARQDVQQRSASPTDKPIAAYSGVFPKPASLEPAVAFWRKTYAVWQRSQVAFHDDRYLDVVYEVMVLPGDVSESLTAEQKNIVSQRREYWKGQLSTLEAKLRYGAALNANDKQLIATLENSGKPLSILAGASDRLRSQRGTRERFKHGLEISGRYDLKFRKIFRNAGLPEDLAYLPHVESSFQASAKSSAGALGLWQFTKAAAKTFMPDGNSVDRRLDPIASASGAAHYLSTAYGKLGDWPTAITSYNHGIGGMKRAQNRMGGDFVHIVEKYDGPAFGFASRNYYAQFLAAREIASKPEQFFSEGIRYESPINSEQYLAAD
ncbi:MAG: lytic transglycosylase domain-containing protein [Methylococcales bacterium]|nr:lytic transglycosylase domain-containing protein [Methylococcales bacterium]